MADGFIKLVEEYRKYSTNVYTPHISDVAIPTCSSKSKPLIGVAKFNVEAHVVEGVKIGLGVVALNSEEKLLLTETGVCSTLL